MFLKGIGTPMKVESFQPKEKIVPIPDGSSFFILGKKNWYVKKKKKWYKCCLMIISDLKLTMPIFTVSESPATTLFIIITSPTSSSSSSYSVVFHWLLKTQSKLILSGML